MSIIHIPKIDLYPPFTQPISADFSWINQGGASVTIGNNRSIYLLIPANGGASVRARVKTAPSTPYSITAAFYINALGNNGAGGLLFRESGTGELETISKAGNSPNLQINRWNSATVFNSTPLDITNGTVPFGSFYYYRITDDGVNRIHSFSVDGVNFIIVYTIARTTFLTADQVGFWVVDNASYDNGMNLFSWRES